MTHMAVKTDLADHVLEEYKEKTKVPVEYTTSWGAPISTRTASMTAGPRGPMMMQDLIYFDELGKFDRERIPERVVHAKGAGVHGYFEVTHDITKYTKAAIFSEVGKKTPMFVRFSVVSAERGAPDTVRDLRGFAMKFYTEQGNWDLVCNNSPIFFIRDPVLFPAFIHSLKRNPKTNLKDMNAFWDFMASRPEGVHQHMMLWSDRGTPDGYRFMHGFGSHTFKLVNKDNDYVYCKFHAISLQGIKNLSAREAEILAGKDPDYATRDLYNAVESGKAPQWAMMIQVMTEDQAQKFRWNPFDLTKVWPHAEFPLIPVGRIVLNKNVTNYFAEVEQVAFSPAHVVPGIDFSPDKMLQGRIFSYGDTQFHRVGTNYQQLQINCPYRSAVNNIQRDGYMCIHSQGDTPAHHPNSFNGPKPSGVPECPFPVNAVVDRYDNVDEDNYSQPRIFWEKVLDADHKKRFVENVANGLCMAALPIQERVIQVFSNVHPDIGKGISTELVKLRGMETSLS